MNEVDTMTYRNKLRDPRWQRRRLEIFNRDGWQCQKCGARDKELHVHHKNYTHEPWGAPDSDLITMCLTCHYMTHNEQSDEERDLSVLLAYPSTFNKFINHSDELVSTIARFIEENKHLATGGIIEEFRDHKDAIRIARACRNILNVLCMSKEMIEGT